MDSQRTPAPAAAPFGPAWPARLASEGGEAPPAGPAPLLAVRDLVKQFPVRRGAFARVHGSVQAVAGVSLTVGPGETLGLVGESGSGKTTLARVVARLIEPTSGEIEFAGQPLHALRGRRLRALRPRLQIIFQDPFSSLNPRRTVLDIVGEALVEHGRATRREASERVGAILDRVGLAPDHLHRYPHEFSGGQRQRIAIARAIALGPDLIVCDEPVSALDVSIQAQVINLLVRLQEEMGLAYLFIAHDLSVVRHVSNRIAVMYLGRIVEHAPAERLFADPRHPYTRCLLAAAPRLDRREARPRFVLHGTVPSPLNPPSGCPFHPRCPEAQTRCVGDAPPVHDHGAGHWSACHFS